MKLRSPSAILLTALLLAGCGEKEPPFVNETVTVVIGSGEKGDARQPVVAGITSVETADGTTLLGELPCGGGDGSWQVKKTTSFRQPVTAGTKATLTLKTADGPLAVPVTFSDGMLPYKKKLEHGGKAITVQSYASVGEKWGLVVLVNDPE